MKVGCLMRSRRSNVRMRTRSKGRRWPTSVRRGRQNSTHPCRSRFTDQCLLCSAGTDSQAPDDNARGPRSNRSSLAVSSQTAFDVFIVMAACAPFRVRATV